MLRENRLNIAEEEAETVGKCRWDSTRNEISVQITRVKFDRLPAEGV